MWQFVIIVAVPLVVIALFLNLIRAGMKATRASGGRDLDMDLIKDISVAKIDGTKKKITEILAENDIVAFYFSAHWCPPCRAFTPVLAALYTELKKAGKKIEVIFMSSDRSEEQMASYMKDAHGDWYALEFNSPVRRPFGEHFSISGIPTLIVVSSKGLLITKDAVSDVMKHGANIWEQWTAQGKKTE